MTCTPRCSFQRDLAHDRVRSHTGQELPGGVWLAKFRVIVAATLALLLSSAVAAAAPLDKAANKKIDEAINEHYLATNFDKAESVLLGTVKACGKKCSPQVIARAYMYVGIVRGSGKSDQKGAQEAFGQALATDPDVKLDAALATPETKATFDAASAGAGAGGAAEDDAEAGEPAEEDDGALPAGAGDERPKIPGNMDCTPVIAQVETRRPIPLSCSTDEDAVRVELRYKEFAGDDWKIVKMVKKDDAFQAQIPCSATQLAGALKFYVTAKDAAGENVDSYGTKRKPAKLDVVAETDEEPPAYPGEEPPERCAEQVECPPDFPGCKSTPKKGGKGWGSTCEQSNECDDGLACVNGACENATACETDSDCKVGSCVNDVCQDAGGSSSVSKGAAKKLFVGVHVAQDITSLSGNDVCGDNEDFICYAAGDEKFRLPEGQAGSNVSGSSFATTRILLSLDYAVLPNVTLGARVGYAFGGAPADFVPFHAEARVAYWFGDLGSPASLVVPYVHLAGGLAQVDASVQAPVVIEDVNVDLVAWKSAGTSFAGGGGGVLLQVGPGGVQANLNLMALFPTSGFVIEPSLGYIVGF